MFLTIHGVMITNIVEFDRNIHDAMIAYIIGFDENHEGKGESILVWKCKDVKLREEMSRYSHFYQLWSITYIE